MKRSQQRAMFAKIYKRTVIYRPKSIKIGSNVYLKTHHNQKRFIKTKIKKVMKDSYIIEDKGKNRYKVNKK
jgi:hypothetical protein